MPFTPTMPNPVLPYTATRQRVEGGLSLSRNQPKFGFMAGPVNWLAENLYEKGDGFRYLMEQTIGFTVPRATQQLMRSYKVTGETNKMAAVEMLVRDIAADFTDTVLPGLLATVGLGVLFDQIGKNNLVSRNIPPDLLELYRYAATDNNHAVNRQAFFQRLETVLKESHLPNASLNLETLVRQIEHQKLALGRINLNPKQAKFTLDHATEALAKQLGLSDLELTLKLPNAKQQFSTTAGDFMRDLWFVTEHKAAPHAETAEWGKHIVQKLEKNKRLAPVQLLAAVMALVASLSVPFLVRMMTKTVYGVDAFPGSKVLDDHYHQKTHTHHTLAYHSAHPEVPWPKDLTQKNQKKEKEPFKPFPYIQDSLKAGKIMPLLTALGFFAVLGGAVIYNRVWKPILSKGEQFTWRKLVNQYAFDRGFPWTPIAQMELTYGMLCGTRLLTARDVNESYETLLRDCLLGWPTLTYGFPVLKKLFAGGYRKLFKGFHNPAKGIHLLTKGGEMRSKKEISEALFRNIKDVGDVNTALKTTQTYQRYITVGTGLLSLGLLGFFEPQLDIAMTDRRVAKQHRKKEVDDKRAEFTRLFTSEYHPLVHRTQSPFTHFQGSPAPSPRSLASA